ncbi:MAG: CHAT domain-containing protein, partial [Cyanobacteria bacterium J06632_3]
CMLLGLVITFLPLDLAVFFPSESTTLQMASPVVAASTSEKDTLEQDLLEQDLLEQGRQAYQTQRFAAAVTAWTQAAQAFDRQNNLSEQALALSYLSAAHQQLGEWTQAKDSIEKSLALVEAMPDAAQILTAQVNNTYGSLQFALGNSQAALEAWQDAATLYLATGEQERYLNNLLNQVQAQQSLGYYHQVARNLQVLEQGLPRQALPLQIQGYQKLGEAYRLIGNVSASEKHLQTAFGLAQQQQTSTASILLSLGNTAQAKNEIVQALDFYRRAIEQSAIEQSAIERSAIERSGQFSNPVDATTVRLKAQLNQLQILAETSPDEARWLVFRLDNDLASMRSGRAQVYAYIHGAQSLLTLADDEPLQLAVRWLAQAVQQAVVLQDSRAEAYARGYLGQVYERSHQWQDAQKLTEEGLAIARSIGAADIIYQWQWQLGRLLKQQNEKEAALVAYRSAYETLQSINQDLVATHQTLQFSFRDSVEPVYRELVDLLLTSDVSRKTPEQLSYNKASDDKIDNDQLRLQEARSVMESLQVAELDNFFRTACLDAQQVALEDVEETEAAIVYPIILSDRLVLLVSLPGQPLQQFTTTVSDSALRQTLLDWRVALEKPFTAPEGKALGEKLYGWIVGPMADELATSEVKTLTFVLEGALRNAPMAALYHDGHYLIQDYAVALSPGLQLLGPRALQEIDPAVILAGLTEARHGFSELENVAAELETVNRLVPSRLLIDEAFTTDSLIAEVTRSNRPIVHLATHGQFSSEADKTFILAWDRPILVSELSELLKTGDLNREDPIELLILSACETANGDSRAALGLAGVALESGTRATLASLWSLDDASGAVFIDAFYQALAQPEMTKAEALRQAQLALLQDANYRHPTYWAAYVLVGNWL